MAITDLFTNATTSSRPVPTTVSSARSSGITTLNCLALTGWPSGTVHGVTYKINTSGAKIAGSQIDFKAIVSGTQLTNFTVKAGTDAGNAVGDVVECAPTAAWANDMVTGITAHANQDGSLKTTAVQTALNLGNTPAAGWTVIGATLTYLANNGNKEYTCTTSIDLTSSLSVGMKLQITRGTTAPTQAMSFTAASSQYATKASPAGLAFTAAYTCEAWVYLNSYAVGTIIGRRSGSLGAWVLGVTAQGQLKTYYGDGAGNFTEFDTYQSLPLKRWVHVAASVSSVASKTATLYINGVAVPTNTSLAAATSLIQAGNLSVGAYGTGTGEFFDGYISEARVWSAAQTQGNIQSNMAISLTGSETNLVALFQGNGNFTDKTTNANTLTANGGAIATQVANPYNNTEYAIITAVTSTQLTLYTGTDSNIPNMTLSAPQYSTARAPYGFPAQRNKWRYSIRIPGNENDSPTSLTWYAPGSSRYQMNIPTGDFVTGYWAPIKVQSAAATTFYIGWSSLSTTTNSEAIPDATAYSGATYSGAAGNWTLPLKAETTVSLAAQTTHYLIAKFNTSGALGVTNGIASDDYAHLWFEPAHL